MGEVVVDVYQTVIVLLLVAMVKGAKVVWGVGWGGGIY